MSVSALTNISRSSIARFTSLTLLIGFGFIATWKLKNLFQSRSRRNRRKSLNEGPQTSPVMLDLTTNVSITEKFISDEQHERLHESLKNTDSETDVRKGEDPTTVLNQNKNNSRSGLDSGHVSPVTDSNAQHHQQSQMIRSSPRFIQDIPLIQDLPSCDPIILTSPPMDPSSFFISSGMTTTSNFHNNNHSVLLGNNNSSSGIGICSKDVPPLSSSSHHTSPDSGQGSESEFNHKNHLKSVSSSNKSTPVPKLSYQFHIPLHLAGKFIGQSGKNVNSLKQESNCTIMLRPKDSLQNKTSSSATSSTTSSSSQELTHKLCILEGTADQIGRCLSIIRERFPESRFPDVTLQAIHLSAQKLDDVYGITSSREYVMSHPCCCLTCCANSGGPIHVVGGGTYDTQEREGPVTPSSWIPFMLPTDSMPSSPLFDLCGGVLGRRCQMEVSHVVSPGHIFVKELSPSSSTSSLFSSLEEIISHVYPTSLDSDDDEDSESQFSVPDIPPFPLVNTICMVASFIYQPLTAATTSIPFSIDPSSFGPPTSPTLKPPPQHTLKWLRAQVMHVVSEDYVVVKLVDYGGFVSVHRSMMKHIRWDLLRLPFQATECYLNAIRPIEIEKGYPLSAITEFNDLIADKVTTCELVGWYANDAIPYINLYVMNHPPSPTASGCGANSSKRLTSISSTCSSSSGTVHSDSESSPFPPLQQQFSMCVNDELVSRGLALYDTVAPLLETAAISDEPAVTCFVDGQVVALPAGDDTISAE